MARDRHARPRDQADAAAMKLTRKHAPCGECGNEDAGRCSHTHALIHPTGGQMCVWWIPRSRTSDHKDFPTCPRCGKRFGLDLEVYVVVEPGVEHTDVFTIGAGGIGIRCKACGEDISDAGDVEFDHPFLAAVASVLEYCTAKDAIREGLDNIDCLRQEEE